MYYREWTPKPEMRRGRMLNVKGIEAVMHRYNPGYASIYAFDEAAANTIMAQGSSIGLDRFPVFSDTLVMDIDVGDAGLKVVREFLDHFEARADVYFSGKKGYHVIVQTTPLFGEDVPYSHARFVESYNLPADMSRYRHDALLRLPNTIHEATGARKTLVERIHGKPLAIPYLVEPIVPYAPETANHNLLKSALQRAVWLMEDEPEPGERHATLWQLALTLREGGLDFHAVLSLLNGVNAQWQNAKSPQEVERAVRQAFRRPCAHTASTYSTVTGGSNGSHAAMY